MFNIDKKKFGAFVAALRKEKGITQKGVLLRVTSLMLKLMVAS